MERLQTPSLRARIVAELDAQERDWSSVMVGGVWHADNKDYPGRTIAEILDDSGCPAKTPGELVCRILEKDLCRTGAFFFGMSEENLEKIYSMPWIVPGSDASLRAPWGPLAADHPHPRAYGTMPEFYRRVAAKAGRETAIARMTSIPARRFGIRDRGVLAAGAFADIAIWREGEFRNTATFAKSHSFCTGMDRVFVNGALAYDAGTFTHAGTGRFLER
jgi:N-acyl-D-aspartate/D-glutamate deacylase